jgi:hypothetical protein
LVPGASAVKEALNQHIFYGFKNWNHLLAVFRKVVFNMDMNPLICNPDSGVCELPVTPLSGSIPIVAKNTAALPPYKKWSNILDSVTYPSPITGNPVFSIKNGQILHLHPTCTPHFHQEAAPVFCCHRATQY